MVGEERGRNGLWLHRSVVKDISPMRMSRRVQMTQERDKWFWDGKKVESAMGAVVRGYPEESVLGLITKAQHLLGLDNSGLRASSGETAVEE